jgi:F-type H+-transporting ATPase subunit b
MSKIALPRVKLILHERQEKIRQDLNEAHAMREKAQAAAAQHDKTINDAKVKSQNLAQETVTRLHAESDAKRQLIETELNAKLTAAEASINEMKTKAMDHVGEIAHETALAIVQHLTGKAADPKAIANAIASTKA